MDMLVGTDGGLVRLSAGREPESDIGARPVAHLAHDGEDWWAVVDDTELWSSGGNGWQVVSPVTGVRARCVLPSSGGLLVGTSEARLLRLRDGVLVPVEAFDEVPGRDSWYTPWGGPPDTRSLAGDADGRVFANVHVGGIPRSDDEGPSWHPTIDVDADVHQVICHGSLVMAATAYGLALSEDAGSTWRFQTEGLHAEYCRAVTVAGDTLLLSVSRSHRGQQAAVYRRPLEGGRAFERCGDGLPDWFDDNIDTHCLAANGERVAFGTADGRVFASDDAGGSWSLLAEALAPVQCLAIA